jgi:hypothetical protein
MEYFHRVDNRWPINVVHLSEFLSELRILRCIEFETKPSVFSSVVGPKQEILHTLSKATDSFGLEKLIAVNRHRIGLATRATAGKMPRVNPGSSERRPPGFLWIVLPGVTCFCAGFFGPMIFMPESNLGPLVGILISGPVGLVLGFILWLVFRFLPVSGRTQWRALVSLCAVATVGILLAVQPEPAAKGYILEVEIRGHRTPAAVADETVAYWRKRIAGVTWAQPRAGWESQMRAALAAGTGTVLDTILVRQRTVKVHRKPWNRGRLFATGWEAKGDECSLYFPSGSLPVVPAPGSRLEYFLPFDSTARIQAPDTWPPADLPGFIHMSLPVPVPAGYQQL